MEFDATFLISIISFIVFVVIMNAVFYAPILKIMQNRNSIVENNFKTAQNIKEQTLTQEQYHSNELESSRNEARNTLDKEMQRLKSEKSAAIYNYKKELLVKAEKEKDDLRNSAIEAKETLKENVVDIAKNISGILLGDIIDSETINKSKIKIKEEQV